ncbi:hypothetical protein HZH66_008300 [Vespula vulgaris]|uniref:Uncharacterized protein n=1 Tax=Vespula vulgaris TaxID=7454 RepID=A0A834JWX0_VESVU|nr:hypothetical protein HZH66_008300 [Vespula vulgaris]
MLVISTSVIASVISTVVVVKAILRTSVINAQQQWCNTCSRTVKILVHGRNRKDINSSIRSSCSSGSSSSSSSTVSSLIWRTSRFRI